MDDEDQSRRILWANVRTLMLQKYGGEENLARVAKDAGFKGGANMTRIKAQKTDVSLKVLRGVSKALGVPIWQLLTPGLGSHLYMLDSERRIVPLFDGKLLAASDTAGPVEFGSDVGHQGEDVWDATAIKSNNTRRL